MNLLPKMLEIKQDKLSFLVLESGDIYKIIYDGTMLNMYPASFYDGSLYNIYLKVAGKTTKLMGIDSNSSFSHIANNLIYQGSFEEVDYQVVISLLSDTWFVTISLASNNKEAELYYCFDVGLANEGVNEAYNCQYIDHNVIAKENTITILSKQNQGRPLMLETSSLNNLDSYSTDGFQFFKNQYKFSNYPEALKQDRLDNEKYQYEFAYLALKTNKETIKGKKDYVFYHKVKDNYHVFPSIPEDRNIILDTYHSLQKVDTKGLKFNNYSKNLDYNEIIFSNPFTKEEINQLFIEKRNEEYDENNNLLSFFSTNNSYVVLQDLERKLKRPTAMVYIANGFKKIEESPMAFTCYMYGVFASHIVLGNTDFNLFNHESKTPLNVLKSKGLRIFIKIDGKYRLLTMPAAFKMDLNMATWYYKINDDIIEINSAICYDNNQIEIEIKSKHKYDFVISNYLHMNNALPEIKEIKNGLSFYFNQNTMVYQQYPNLHYNYQILNHPFKQVNDLYSDNYPLILQQIEKTNDIKLLISASFENDDNFKYQDISKIKDEYYRNFKNNILNLDVKGNDQFINKVNDLTVWYTENALIHYASPHGLEQCFGAAWGLRDVLQGPFEMFLTYHAFDIAKDILLKVYSRQFVHNYNWPQWFMFDKYKNIQAGDSHGDIIVWPLKAIAKYILTTGDIAILSQEVPYFDFYQGRYSDVVDTVFNHIVKEIETIKNSFIKGYYLPCYGGGDWDDTLQPKDHNKAANMVSGWTVALLLDGLKTFLEVLDKTEYDLSLFKEIYAGMKADFEKYIIKDNIPSGFIYFHDDKIDYILHPLDHTSNIRYRLLPLTRGMIASLYSTRQVNQYLEIIDNYLNYSDGVRLMSDAIKYQGGKNDLFMRAETASNFGREISLQYVHAHIRYLEAMAFIGKNERLYDGLNKIVPININKYVSNAKTRQANVYFSSSDGAFLNRYDACQNFYKLKSKEVDVLAGWRLYSSGPGIYLCQLYTHFFGISFINNKLALDPIMIGKLDKTTINIRINNKNVTIVYHLINQDNVIYQVKVDKQIIDFKQIDNCYRKSDIIIDNELIKDNSLIEIYCK